MKFGIAHPITNNRFNRCKVLSTTIASTKSGSIVVNIPPGAPSDLDRFFAGVYGNTSKQIIGKVNKCIIGPSTSSSNSGAVETLNVISVTSPATINFEKSIQYSYVIDDPITLIGAGFPDGWEGRYPGMSYNAFPYGSIFSTDGYSDQFTFRSINISPTSNAIASIEMPRLSGRTYYRLEICYRSSSNFSGTVTIYVYDDNRSVNTNSLISIGKSTSWATAYSIFQSAETQGGLPFITLDLSSASGDWFELASISLTSAPYESTSIYKTQGVSTISEYPDFGSIRIYRVTGSTRLGHDSQGRGYIKSILDSVNLPVTSYKISYRLTNISESSAEVFRNLINWQQRGYLINHFPELEGLPYCLTGRITSRQSWNFFRYDYTRQSFSFVFEEVPI